MPTTVKPALPALPAPLPFGNNVPVLPGPLRISVVTETYPPEVNGVAVTLARTVQGLHALGHQLQLVRPRQHTADSAAPQHRFDQVLVRSLCIPRYAQLKMGLPSRRTLLAQWRQRRPDVVHIATEGPLGWSALQAARALGVPVTSDFRTNFHAYSRHYGVGWLGKPILAYLRSFHNRTLTTMVPTQALAHTLASLGLQRLQVVGRGVDTQRFSPDKRSGALRASWGVAAHTLVVACVGRLAPEKNLDALLAAFAAVHTARPDSRLLLVGDGPLRAALQQACPHAIFAGLRSGDDLAAHYASADLFLFPSTTETFGNVTAEAMASGLPVVAYAQAAAAQLIHHGHNGWLVPLDQTPLFTQQAVAAALDPALARVLGRRARATALLHGWDHIVGQVDAVLRQAAGQQGQPASAASRPCHHLAVPASHGDVTMAGHAEPRRNC